MRLPDIASSAGPIKISMQIIASYAHRQLAVSSALYTRDLLSTSLRPLNLSFAKHGRLELRYPALDFKRAFDERSFLVEQI